MYGDNYTIIVDLQQENSVMILKQTSVCEYNKPLPKELLHLFLNNEDKKAALRPTFILLLNKSVRRSSIFTVIKTALLGSANGCWRV